MTPRTYLKQIALALVLLTASVEATAQRSAQKESGNRSLSYGFVSPNMKEELSLDDAILAIASTEEWDLVRKATNLRCVVKTQIRVYPALGSWSDGAEHSTMLQIHTDEPTIRYLVSRLGLDADQKAVLYFHENETGSAKLYVLRPKRIRKFQTIIRLLDNAGIAFRTLVPTRNYTYVYIVDNENQLREKVSSAARLLNSGVTIRTGISQFIGDDSQREKAKQIYTEELKKYETLHAALPDACRGN